MAKNGATVQVVMIQNPDAQVSSWFESEERARHDMEISHRDYDFSLVTARLTDDAGRIVALWDPVQKEWVGPGPVSGVPDAVSPAEAVQAVMPGVEHAGTENLVKQLADAGQLISISVQHRMAYTGGWHDGWHASVCIHTRPPDREGEHPCVVFGRHPNDPVAALKNALVAAIERVEIER